MKGLSFAPTTPLVTMVGWGGLPPSLPHGARLFLRQNNATSVREFETTLVDIDSCCVKHCKEHPQLLGSMGGVPAICLAGVRLLGSSLGLESKGLPPFQNANHVFPTRPNPLFPFTLRLCADGRERSKSQAKRRKQLYRMGQLRRGGGRHRAELAPGQGHAQAHQGSKLDQPPLVKRFPRHQGWETPAPEHGPYKQYWNEVAKQRSAGPLPLEEQSSMSYGTMP